MLPFCCYRGLLNGEKPIFTGFFVGVKLFPLFDRKVEMAIYRAFRGSLLSLNGRFY